MGTESSDITKRLDEISRQFGRSDKEIAISNLAHKSLTLLQGKNGKLDGADRADVLAIANHAISMGNRHFPPGDPDEEKPAKVPKGLSKGSSGKGGLRGNSKGGRNF